MRRMPYLSQKIEARNFPAGISIRNCLWVGRGEPLCRHYTDCSFVSGHSDITTFQPCSPIATGKILGRAEKITEVAQTTGTADVSDPRSGISGPTGQRASACPNVQE
jgi:hypothetical protein